MNEFPEILLQNRFANRFFSVLADSRWLASAPRTPSVER
jgi:hypothetical protein